MPLKSRSNPTSPASISSLEDERSCLVVLEEDATNRKKKGAATALAKQLLLCIVLVCLMATLAALQTAKSTSITTSSPLQEQFVQDHKNEYDVQEHATVRDVVIVGAGWAGLAAAYALLEDNDDDNHLKPLDFKNVEILEARDYVGGRSRTIYPFGVEDLPVEVGSAWTYADTEPHKLMLAQNIPYGHIHYDNATIYGLYEQQSRGNGGEVTGDSLQKYAKLWDSFTQYSQQTARKLQKDQKDATFQDIVEAFLKEHQLSSSQKARLYLQTMVHAQIEIEFAAPADEISARFVGTSVRKECIFCGANYYVPVQHGGFDKILKPLFSRKIRKATTLKSRVTQIEYTEGRLAKVTYQDSRGRYHSRKAKAVLVTVPLGVLKRKAIHFVPSLPKAKQDAIQAVGFGVLDKCVFYWEQDQSSWWPAGKQVLTYLADTKKGSFTTFFNDKELGNGDHCVLSAWTGGADAVAMESLSNETIVNMVWNNLKNMFGDNVPEPTKYVISRWGQDKFAYGSYSFVPVDRQHGGLLVDSARRELGARTGSRLFWAGEATHSKWYGTTVGAYRSGHAAAQDILGTLPLLHLSSTEK